MANDSIDDDAPDAFWSTVEAARQEPARLRDLLRAMRREEIVHFCWTYEELAVRLRTERHATHADAGLSEDGLSELANWVVAQGRCYYVEILNHPERIPARKNDVGLLSALVEEYEERFGDDVPPNTRRWDIFWKRRGKTSPWD